MKESCVGVPTAVLATQQPMPQRASQSAAASAVSNASAAPRACPVCGHGQAQPLFARDGYDIVRCPGCDLVLVAQDPAQIDFQSLYGESYYQGGSAQVFADYTGQQHARRASARRRLWALRTFERGFPKRGRLLDVGCAAGFFLAEAQRWYDVQGVELSAWSSAYARAKLGLNVFSGSLQEAALPAGRFALVTMWDVIEHVADPVAVLREAARVLAPGGRVVLTTGDLGSAYARAQGTDTAPGEHWHLMTPPWHLSFFTRASLVETARRAGLQVLHIRSEGVAGDGFWWRNPVSLLLSRALGWGDIMRVTLVAAAAGPDRGRAVARA